MDDKILHYIWLSNALKPGSKTAKILLCALGTIDKVYNADSETYHSLGVSGTELASLKNKDLTLSESHYNYCMREHIGFLMYEDPYYPERLKLIENPPPMFYYRGRLMHLDDYPCVAMVGTRSCSEAGFRLAYNTAYECAARGIVVTNGIAAGIDGACIAAALDANAYCIAVLGCGIDRIYPEENRDLFLRLSANGLILTEFAPFTEPKGTNFPVRNRVISGLCLATAVFEAEAERSGAMITAHYALSHGRRIFAVPAKPYDKSYSGPLELIKDGASVLTEADDILCEYSMMFPHRINLHHVTSIPKEHLEKYISHHFKKKSREMGTTPVKTTSELKSVRAAKPASIEIAVKPDATHQSQAATVESSKADTSLLSVTENKIYCLFVEKQNLSPDEIVSFGIRIEDVLSSITLLEVYGLIKGIPGGRYVLNTDN